VLRGVVASVDAEHLIEPLLDRKLKDLDQVERALLRSAPAGSLTVSTCLRVIIDECVALARTFGAEESHKYINAVLDALARALRAREVANDG
jgi:N utilization substance protein B